MSVPPPRFSIIVPHHDGSIPDTDLLRGLDRSRLGEHW
jgi:hypothetical protein